jgi:hypothetical protein
MAEPDLERLSIDTIRGCRDSHALIPFIAGAVAPRPA